MVACAPGRDGSGCLTARQVNAVTRLMSPVVNSKGEVIYAYPYLPGTETQWTGWNYGTFANYTVAYQLVKFLADPTPRKNVDPLTFDFDRDPATLARAERSTMQRPMICTRSKPVVGRS